MYTLTVYQIQRSGNQGSNGSIRSKISGSFAGSR
jgi:hypothetical protein